MSSNKAWIYHTNIYEVNLRQYTIEGTFNAFTKHIPRLKNMGVQTLWFMPITPISEKEKKGSLGSYYACSDYISINPEFGTLSDFKELVRTAHNNGLKVIIDWVANHTGWDHTWTKNHPDWYEKDEITGEFKRASGMDDIIELDFNNPELRKAMIDAMKFWVEECVIDGFRCDLAFWVELHFWEEAIPQLNELRPLFWLAESDPLEHPDYMQVFDAAYTWTWMHKAEEFYKKKLPFKDLINVLVRYQASPGIKAWFTSNHDENSWNGTEYEKYGLMAKALAVFSCTWPGIPLLYSGQELPNKKRLKFFDKDIIEWADEYALHDFYKKLLTLHHTHPALNAKAELFRLHTSADSNIFAYLRKKSEKEILVIMNWSNSFTRFRILDTWLKGNFQDIFSGDKNNITTDKSFELEAWDYLVFESVNYLNQS